MVLCFLALWDKSSGHHVAEVTMHAMPKKEKEKEKTKEKKREKREGKRENKREKTRKKRCHAPLTIQHRLEIVLEC